MKNAHSPHSSLKLLKCALCWNKTGVPLSVGALPVKIGRGGNVSDRCVLYAGTTLLEARGASIHTKF